MRKLIIISILTLVYAMGLFGSVEEVGAGGYWYAKFGESRYGTFFTPNKLSYVGSNPDTGETQFTNVLIYDKEDGSIVFAFSYGDGADMSKRGLYRVDINGTYDDIPVTLENPTLVSGKYVYFKMSREDAFKIFNNIFTDQEITDGQIEFIMYHKGYAVLHITAPATNEWRRLFGGKKK